MTLNVIIAILLSVMIKDKSIVRNLSDKGKSEASSSAGIMNDHTVENGEGTVSRVFGLSDDILNHMMYGFTDVPTFLAFRRVSKDAYRALTNGAKKLCAVKNFKQGHEITYGMLFSATFLQFIANPTYAKELSLTERARVDVNDTPEDAFNKLHKLNSRYERLQKVIHDLYEELSVFAPSIQAFSQQFLPGLIEAARGTIRGLGIGIAYFIIKEVYSIYSSCEVIGRTHFLKPCTVWGVMEHLYISLTIIPKMLLANFNEFFGTGLLINTFIFVAIAILITLVPAQITQYRNRATTILESVGNELM